MGFVQMRTVSRRLPKQSYGKCQRKELGVFLWTKQRSFPFLKFMILSLPWTLEPWILPHKKAGERQGQQDAETSFRALLPSCPLHGGIQTHIFPHPAELPQYTTVRLESFIPSLWKMFPFLQSTEAFLEWEKGILVPRAPADFRWLQD